ncbi:MAG: AAA family ATPase, partial [Muribaculaceae bacterium]|nr:AAA family ATPase [Muribaculaceae bacterium]
MKIRRLVIHNIASIEDAEIDFDADPLKDCEVFLITGRTGSGKTTILDSICLALYNNVPRMKISDMDGNLVDSDGKTLKVNDCRNLLRRSCGSGFVRVSFTGNDSREYEAEWSVRRAREKAQGVMQPSRRVLTDLADGFEWRKEKEINAE